MDLPDEGFFLTMPEMKSGKLRMAGTGILVSPAAYTSGDSNARVWATCHACPPLCGQLAPAL